MLPVTPDPYSSGATSADACWRVPVSSDRFHIITNPYEEDSYKQSSVNNADHDSDIPEGIAERDHGPSERYCLGSHHCVWIGAGCCMSGPFDAGWPAIDAVIRTGVAISAMPISVRTLDDGAWISVDDSRAVGVSDIWPLAVTDFCDCQTAQLLLEAFYDVGVVDGWIVADGVGQCIDCGTAGSVERLAVGRVVDGQFYPVAPESVQSRLEDLGTTERSVRLESR